MQSIIGYPVIGAVIEHNTEALETTFKFEVKSELLDTDLMLTYTFPDNVYEQLNINEFLIKVRKSIVSYERVQTGYYDRLVNESLGRL